MDSLSFSAFDFTVWFAEPGHRSRDARRGVSRAPDAASSRWRSVRRGPQLTRGLAESCDAGLRHLRVVLSVLLIATGLENELLPGGSDHASVRRRSAAIDAVTVHLCIYHRQEPWLIALGGASVVGCVISVLAVGLASNEFAALTCSRSRSSAGSSCSCGSKRCRRNGVF